ncbi:response regulator [Geminocystis sp. CENA526]|uniref:hybrid sensor histidine kinase/response regulator n=1 Tax=Geminocystis sp. CENA526 TaxID=1355871 RepID=UPI003D6E29AB
MNKQYSLLIIDDDPNNFDVIEGLLYKYNYSLYYLTSGIGILEQLAMIKPDLILLDVMMPDLNGIEVCKIIKADQRWKSIPIIMVTALEEKKDLALCLDAGADDFISKPVNSIELSARVNSMLRIKQQYDFLQESLMLRQEMTNIIIHDLRNPLANILLCAGILKMPNISPNISTAKIDEIITSSQVLNNQIDNLLQMAKIQSGKIILDYELTNINQFLITSIDDFKTIAQSKNIELLLNLPSDDITVYFDRQIMKRVLDNLLSNAIKFSPKNSNVICQLNYLESDTIQIKIIDTAIPIPDEKKEVIFEKYQIGLPLKGVKQIGLGLAFCKLGIEAHHGIIRVENNPDGGNIFIIELSLGQHNMDDRLTISKTFNHH